MRRPLAALLVPLLWWASPSGSTSSAADKHKRHEQARLACSALQYQYPHNMVWDPNGPVRLQTRRLPVSAFVATVAGYWNGLSLANRPACIFYPEDAEQVSYAVRVLGLFPAVRMALKAGGANPNVGFASVDGGVLIAFRPGCAGVRLADDGRSVTVGAGAKWDEVYAALRDSERTVVGSRFGDVGVAGFVLGGGLSYLSAQHGLASDNVISYTCVLADGSVVVASATAHADLFRALGGGGNRFAIVTDMVLRTHPVGDAGLVWGGMRTYSAANAFELLYAVSNFTANNADPRAAIVPTFNFIRQKKNKVSVATVFFFYDGAFPPDGVFDEFDLVDQISSTTATRSYLQLTRQVFSHGGKGVRFQVRGNTFPNMPMPYMATFLDAHFDQVLAAADVKALATVGSLGMLSFAVQPMSRTIAEASRRASGGGGGNSLGLVPEYGDRIFVEYNIAWVADSCDVDCPDYVRETADSGLDLHRQNFSDIQPTNYEKGDLKLLNYNPIFMNDAQYDQDVLQSYGNDTYQRLKAVQKKYDPDGFFVKRQEGFKFTT